MKGGIYTQTNPDELQFKSSKTNQNIDDYDTISDLTASCAEPKNPKLLQLRQSTEHLSSNDNALYAPLTEHQNNAFLQFVRLIAEQDARDYHAQHRRENK